MQYRICMVCDFFYPNFGGIESHIFQLSQCLIQKGHKVVVVTHMYENRKGVRYMTNGLKVYYLPAWTFYAQTTFPTLYAFLPLLREIFIREQITIVHGHQAFSNLANEAIMHAKTMGYRTCFTDHSLTSFADLGSLHMNKILKFTLTDVDHVICVSHTSKENTVLRGHLDPEDVSVIPNAVDANVFVPNSSARSSNCITIVVVSRLTYRKGIDLLVRVIPAVCARYRHVNFLVAGDGPKRIQLEQMREKYELQDRVKLLGPISHSDVPKVLVKGHIFLNTSLTEAFCMAVVEAAACGLLVVSTNVGGVPEVLPPHMIILSPPSPSQLIDAVGEALEKVGGMDGHRQHEEVKRMYSWEDVANRTLNVYRRISAAPQTELPHRLVRFYGCGRLAGPLFCGVIAVDHLLVTLLDWMRPPSSIDIAPDFPHCERLDQDALDAVCERPEQEASTSQKNIHVLH